MKEGFTRKKVPSLTLGEKLKKLRSDFRISLAEVSKATHIQVRYLEYLESGKYEKLPADVYVRGFLRSYARYLNIDEQVLVKLYERERNIQTNLGLDTAKKTLHVRQLNFFPFVITSRSLAIAFIFLIVAGAFTYLYQEFRSFAGEPRLIVLSPMDGTVVETSEITVTGKTDPDARVSINQQSVFVGNDGTFSSQLILKPGLNAVNVVAVNRFSKEKAAAFTIDARYALPETQPSSFRLEVSTRDAPLKIVIVSDGQSVYDGLLNPGEIKLIEAQERVSIVSEDAAKTFVRFNGSGEEPLGVAPASSAPQEVIFTSLGKQQ